jgi:hypothetical protein
MTAEPLSAALLAKINEQIERTERLIDMVPDDRLGWAPDISRDWPVSVLLGHLLVAWTRRLGQRPGGG